MSREEYNEKIIDDAVAILNDDGVIIVPTDTVYGLAIRSDSEIAMKKIYAIKKRNLNKKLPVIVDTYERLLSLCDIEIDVIRRLHPFFPGKLTLVLKRKYSDETIAVRMIHNEIINRIIEKLDCALMLTSANVSGNNTSNDISDLIDEFDGKVDMIIMGDKVGKVSSTIVEIENNELKLIREGEISFEKIKEVYYRG